jgi:PAS domain S-box-containing protein
LGLSITDITERVKTEKALRESEKRYRDLFESVPIGLYNTTPQGELIDVNAALVDMLMYPDRETLLSVNVSDLWVSPENRLAQQAQLKQDGIIRNFEMQLYRYDGSIIWAQDTAQVIEQYDESYLSPGSLIDITERKQAEEALIESESKFRSIVDSSPMGMHMYQLEDDNRLVFTGANPAANLMLGVNCDQFIGMTIEEAFPPLVDTDVPPAYRLAAREGVPWVTDQIIYEENEIAGAFEVYAFQTSPGRMVALFLEITERKKAEETLKNYSERLEEKVAERTQELQEIQEQLVQQEKLAVLGKLAGGMGHELRNPLGVINNAVYYLRLILPNAEETVENYLEIIQSETQQAAKIVADLLSFASNKNPKPDLHFVHEIIAEIVAEHPAPENIEIHLNILPDSAPVFIDSHQIKLGLENLIINAYQAMPDGGHLTIHMEQDQDEVVLSIRDTGVGIAEENIEDLFKPLYTTKARGIGLGLAIAKKYVEANAGSIFVQSVENHGTTFTVRLPIHP